jgi:YjjI family glycine radical enzyme
LDAKLRRFWIQLDRLLPDAFTHANVGPADGRVIRSIWRVERSLRQVVPNLTLKVSPATPDDLIEDAVRTVFVTAKPHFVNHPMMVADHGTEYAAVSCYNSLKVRGGAHTLVRLNLKRAVDRHLGGVDAFCLESLPHWVELTSELGAARIRSLVEDAGFFESNFLATEGLIELDRFSMMFGIFGLAECVNELMVREGQPEARYGHDARANAAAHQIVGRIAELIKERPLPYCEGGGGFAYLHSQSGIDLDLDATAGTRIPIGDEPSMLEHIEVCAPIHQLFPAGISDIFHVEETVTRNPRAMVDVIRGALGAGMRDFTFNLDSNEFIRITGYLVRKSDLLGVDEHGARHSSDYLAATAEVNHTVTTRAIKRVIAAELSPKG